VMSAIAAKKVGRPVKLTLTRKQMFSGCGHRCETRQKVSLGASRDGKLSAIKHETLVQTSTMDEFVEACGTTTSFLYRCPNVEIAHHAVRVNIATPTPMRAPGESPGLFALESAMDELAYKLNMDPVQLRLINHADKNEHTNLPWSSKYLQECYQVAGEAFGWSKRDPRPGSMRDGHYLVGWGMATATFPGYRSPGSAKVRILQDGSAMVSSATQDMCGGTYTTMTQVVSDVTGIPVHRIHPAFGDSHLPPAPVSGGSMTTTSVLSAVKQAAENALKNLVRATVADAQSPLHGQAEDAVMAAHGYVFLNGSAPESGVAYSQVLAASNQAAVEGEGFLAPGEERERYAFQSWGAQFVEVQVDPDVAKVIVSRVVSAFDIGRVINQKTVRSQAYSGIIMGIGMALMEHTVYDHRDGGILTSNLADYAVPVNADVHAIDIHFIDKPDPYIDPMGIGARGAGEIPITGVAPAIANAIYHATGKRIRELPITLDKLL
jgi:xanthine dehydrogenase YagR molybdenum-binding subunit